MPAMTSMLKTLVHLIADPLVRIMVGSVGGCKVAESMGPESGTKARFCKKEGPDWSSSGISVSGRSFQRQRCEDIFLVCVCLALE